MHRAVLVLVSILLMAGVSSAQSGDEIAAAIDSRDYVGAIAKLVQVEANDPAAFVEQNFDYMLARACDFTGRHAEAAARFHAVANREASPYRAYALAHLSRLMRESGSLLMERAYLEQLLALNRPKFNPAARFNLARNAGGTANHSRSIRLLSASSQAVPGILVRDDTALLAASYARLGETQRARQIYEQLIASMPDPDAPDDAALASAAALDEMDAGAPLSEGEHLRRAKIYQFNREFGAAKVHFEAVIGRFPDSGAAPAAMLDIARGFAQLGEHVEALKWYERVQERYPGSPQAKDGLLFSAGAYGRVAKYKEAVTRYQRFIDRYPDDERLDRAYLNLIDLARDQSDDFEAQKWAAKTREKFAGKLPETLAMFSEARIFLCRSEWPKALEKLESLETRKDLGGASTPGGTTRQEVKFLHGYVLEQLGRYDEAIGQYLSIPDGRGEYYGWRASERLAGLRNLDAARDAVSRRLQAEGLALASRSAIDRQRAAAHIVRLAEAGELIRSATEILTREFPAESFPQPQAAFRPDLALSFDVAAAAEPSRTVAAAESAFKSIAADAPLAVIPAASLRGLYPRYFAPQVHKFALRSSIDPRFELAIIRQESRFSPNAKSVSAARGLTQFISSAAESTASRLGFENFDQRMLYSPSVAIAFGSHYLAELSSQFPQQGEAIAASYNGGVDNTKRWIARSRSSEPDRFVAEIQFAQTKDYVQKVMASYRVYQHLYDENLRPRMTIRR